MLTAADAWPSHCKIEGGGYWLSPFVFADHWVIKGKAPFLLFEFSNFLHMYRRTCMCARVHMCADVHTCGDLRTYPVLETKSLSG